MFNMTLYCPLHTPFVEMKPLVNYDVVQCPECGNAMTGLQVWRKWGGLLRARRAH